MTDALTVATACSTLGGAFRRDFGRRRQARRTRMIAIPAVDLRGGACVQLVGGSYDHERLRFDNPQDVALGWARLGFHRLHVVDLDAALGRGSNEDLVADLLRDREASIQVGGGIRSGD